MINIAKKSNLAIHENYMFKFHKQIEGINNLILSGDIGEIRQFRIAFGFPKRKIGDFRYNYELGGGAIWDVGGYVLKYADYLLGGNVNIEAGQLNYSSEFNVDIFGSAFLTNDQGITALVSFGMDNDYKCELEVWGSKGTLYTGRILTAPEGYETFAIITKNGEKRIIKFGSDDTFYKSILCFENCIKNNKIRNDQYNEILHQAKLVDRFYKLTRN